VQANRLPQSEAMTSENDRHSVEALLRIATDQSVPDEAHWDAVVKLQCIGSGEVLRACQELARSSDPWSRRCAVAVAGQLGSPGRNFPAECKALIAPLLSFDEPVEVLSDAIAACGHLYGPDETSPVAIFVAHPDPDVRFAVAFALGGHQQTAAVDALIRLSADTDSNVRNWATFGLGTQIDDDDPAIADALLARVEDGDLDTRDEALIGLARRGDLRVLAPLQAALEADSVGELAVEAAGNLACAELIPSLEKLALRWDRDQELLRAALLECAGTPAPTLPRRWSRTTKLERTDL